MEQLESKIVSSWIEYMVSGVAADASPEARRGHMAWSILANLAEFDPPIAWKLITALIERNGELGYNLVGDIAAGPFEDLITGIPGSLEEFFGQEDLEFVDILLPHIIYSLAREDKQSWLGARKRLLAGK